LPIVRIGGEADLNKHARHVRLAQNLEISGYSFAIIGWIDLAQLFLYEDSQLLTVGRTPLIEGLRAAASGVLRESVHMDADKDVCPGTIGQISSLTQLYINIIVANQESGKTLVLQLADKGFCHGKIDVFFHKSELRIPSSYVTSSMTGIYGHLKARVPRRMIDAAKDQGGRQSYQQQRSQPRRAHVSDRHGIKNGAHPASLLRSGEAYRMRVVRSFMPSVYTCAFNHSSPLR
jgi:hypothetical protein